MAKTPLSFTLPAEARRTLQQMLRSGKHPTRALTRARLLLKLADGLGPSEVARQVGVSEATVYNTRATAIAQGWQAVLAEKPRSGRPPVIAPSQRAEITALACSPAPEGHARWSLRLLADRAVALELIETISHESVRVILQTINSSRT